LSFKFNFEPAQLRAILKNNPNADAWFTAFNTVLPKYDIDTELRVAGFLAQAGHESNNFTVLVENLNYSVEGLRKIFPKYFINRRPEDYARRPQKIANHVYAGRMNNGPESSGDGWRFRGRGTIQLTGRANYTNFAAHMNMTLDEVISYLETRKGAVASAAWVWQNRNLNAHADKGDIIAMTKIINGGTNGLEDRKAKYALALTVLRGSSAPHGGAGGATRPVVESTGATLKRGSQGPEVARLQRELKLTPADGIFGSGTEAALKKWQAANGLKPDGVVGPSTLAKLYS